MHLRIFPEHQKLFSKEMFFTVWSGYKPVFMHLRILPDHQKLFVKKYIFYHLVWLKAGFDAFAHTSRTPETFFLKRYFLLSGVLTKVFLCIFASFHTTRNLFSEKIFFTVWSG
jgi:hypothetical protein